MAGRLASVSKGLDFTDALRDYLVAHSITPTKEQHAIVDATIARVPDVAIMQIPAEQGALMTFLAGLVGAELAVEVGTFTGYSALSIALGLVPGGRLICCDVSEEYTSVGRPMWDAAGVGDRIEVRLGPAAETLAAMAPEPHIDLAFVDADKTGYVDYYELLLPRMKPTGLMVIDNVLQGGAVLDAENHATNTDAIRHFNDHVAADPRAQVVMLNIADGLTLIRPT
jgi:caffeoyl-CoA O-methyltransferase